MIKIIIQFQQVLQEIMEDLFRSTIYLQIRLFINLEPIVIQSLVSLLIIVEHYSLFLQSREMKLKFIKLILQQNFNIKMNQI